MEHSSTAGHGRVSGQFDGGGLFRGGEVCTSSSAGTGVVARARHVCGTTIVAAQTRWRWLTLGGSSDNLSTRSGLALAAALLLALRWSLSLSLCACSFWKGLGLGL